MNEEVFRPPDIVPFVGSLQTACDTFLMDDTYLRKGPCFESNTTDSVSGLQPSSSDRDHEMGFRKQSSRTRRRCSTECGAPLIAFSDNQFRVHFRMNADTFEILCSVLFQHVPKENPIRGRKPIPLDRKVLMCLYFLGSQGESIRSIAKKFDMCESSASVILDSIIKALNNLKAMVIRWPASADINEIVKGFFDISAFPNVLGIMATTHIPILAPNDHPEVFLNSWKCHTIVLQAICNHRMKFVDCYTGWPGSVHDSAVLCESDIFRKIENKTAHYFPERDSHLLGAAVYPLRKWLMTPYVEEEENYLLPCHQEYNKKLKETRFVAQHTFMLLKGRWKRLKFVGMTRTALIPNVIIACCVLHNFCLGHEEEFKDFVNGESLPNDEAFQSHNVTFPNDEAGRLKREAIMAYINNN